MNDPFLKAFVHRCSDHAEGVFHPDKPGHDMETGMFAHIVAEGQLSVKNQVPGHGWGCLACNLPSDGASAVICASCLPGFERGDVKLQFACRGYPATDGRVPIGELTEPHEHDPEVDHG